MTSALELVRTRVDAMLADRLARVRAELMPVAPQAAELLDALQDAVAGGKRLRAAFTYFGWRVHGGDADGPPAEAVWRLGAANELFQAAALVHDDVMDDSDTRRGRPSAHRRFGSAHADAGLAGDPRRFGDAAAILLGDLALVVSDQEVADAVATLPRERARAVRVRFDLMRAEVTVGQYLDTLAQAQPWGADPDADEQRARAVIRAKAARYSVEHPLVVGALLAGADAAQVEVCERIGLPLGEAFQLRDDLLGVVGDPSTTGKPVGDDLREGKRTVLVARAARRALAAGDHGTVDLIGRLLGDRDAGPEAIADLAAAIVATGAPDEVEDLIEELAGGALGLIEAQPWPSGPARGLAALARLTVRRDA